MSSKYKSIYKLICVDIMNSDIENVNWTINAVKIGLIMETNLLKNVFFSTSIIRIFFKKVWKTIWNYNKNSQKKIWILFFKIHIFYKKLGHISINGIITSKLCFLK
jgi:hypothetical protein